MHQTTGRWQLGLMLSLTTVAMWGILPVVLKLLLGHMDAVTITWYRFLVATIVIGVYLIARKRLPRLSRISRVGLFLLAIAIGGLAGNYLLYLLSLELISPGTAQVVIQLAPILLIFGGLIVFREKFNRKQWFGMIVLMTGLALFFNRRLIELFSSVSEYTIGVMMVIAASFTWAAYALAQKQLLNQLGSDQIMFILYMTSALLFWPQSQPAAIFHLNSLGFGLLAFASLNTLVAYGAFAEALNHWQASRISAILALTPLLTLTFVEMISRTYPDILAREEMGAIALTGALLVVLGTVLTALAGSNKHPRRVE